MQTALFSFILLCCGILVQAQKPIIDSSAIAAWPMLDHAPTLTSDGNYFMYTISNRPVNNQTLVIQGIYDGWKSEFIGVSFGFFTDDAKHAVVKRNDTLFVFSLGSSKFAYYCGVGHYQQPRVANGTWFAYKSLANPNDLKLINLVEGTENNFESVIDYSFNAEGQILILKRSVKYNHMFQNSLCWIDLRNMNEKVIWSKLSRDKDLHVRSYNFDNSGSQLAFITPEDKGSISGSALCYYKSHMRKAIVLATDRSKGISAGLSIDECSPSFTLNDQYILFSLKKTVSDCAKPNNGSSQVDVWSYTDPFLQSQQLLGFSAGGSETQFSASISTKGEQVVRLQFENQTLMDWMSKSPGEFMLVSEKDPSLEYWWPQDHPAYTSLVSLKNGARKLLNSNDDVFQYLFSPNDRHLVYFDRLKKCYFSYNLVSGARLNISLSTAVQFEQDSDLPKSGGSTPVGIAGWVANGEAILVYDEYDIWQLDLVNIHPPINLTNGYGRKNKIKLRLLDENNSAVYSAQDTLLLVAFDMITKSNGFFQMLLSGKNPISLIMNRGYFYTQDSQINGIFDIKPIKASAANKWVLRLQSPNYAPNFVFTADFKDFIRLTNSHPQEEYNWLTKELISFKKMDGTYAEGLLYKPEDFDSLKKYPIIFNYYQKLSHKMYEFPQPQIASHSINIAWFVSRGYLVFTPDIYYTVGKPGISIQQSMVSAVEYLKRFYWIDTTKMGISGQSFGGYETNLLITHTDIFAAAVSTSGLSDLVSHYGQFQGVIHGNIVGHQVNEIGQNRIGSTLWERPDLYIENSPVFHIDKITTPILLMANSGDGIVSWMQGVEFFSGLRRLQKRAWMLQYDKGGHGVSGTDAIDYTIRSTQFFDHYLKGYPPPKWMTQGRPATLKQIDDRFELDLVGSCGDSCKICKEKNYDMDAVLDVMNPNKKREGQRTSVKKP